MKANYYYIGLQQCKLLGLPSDAPWGRTNERMLFMKIWMENYRDEN